METVQIKKPDSEASFLPREKRGGGEKYVPKSRRYAVAEEEVPTSFCPFVDGECHRLACQLWCDDGTSLGCAFFFMGLRAQQGLKEGEMR